MSGLSQVEWFYKLAHMVILCCLLKRKVEWLFTYVLAIALFANTVMDAWLLACFDDLLSLLKGARVFSSLYLLDGCH